MIVAAQILVVDDEQHIRTLLLTLLESAGYRVSAASSGEEALTLLAEENPQAMIVDLMLPGMDGMILIERIVSMHPELPILMLTAHGTIANAVAAMKKGAFDFLAKPFEMSDLLARVEKAVEVGRLKGEVVHWRTLAKERYQFEHIITGSEKMRQVLSQVAQIAPSDATVCIYGESGTGKELIAKALHMASRRATGPFIAINCGAIPEGLLENELFGHVKGAYTGAEHAKRGLLQQAEGGTLFLDEVGELPLTLQVKMLRVLQEREFYAVGAERPTKVDIRLVAATNQDLGKAIAAGKFREDLYYRLHVVPVLLPPLRERREDIPLLAQHFLQRCSQTMNKAVHGFTQAAAQQLLAHNWPGNVRELANVMERAVILATSDLITPELLLLNGRPQSLSPVAAPASMLDIHAGESHLPPLLGHKTLQQVCDEMERAYLVQALTETKGTISQAAKLIGVKRSSLYPLLRKHALDPDAFKSS